MLEVIESRPSRASITMTIHAASYANMCPSFANVSPASSAAAARYGPLEWASQKDKNFLYERFDDICKVFKKHDVSFSLGDGCGWLHR